MTDRLRVAAIITIYHPKSHADVIATKFMKGMSTDEGFFPPEVDLVSLYIDHILENDIGVGTAGDHCQHGVNHLIGQFTQVFLT